jgi:hypothetical protein
MVRWAGEAAVALSRPRAARGRWAVSEGWPARKEAGEERYVGGWKRVVSRRPKVGDAEAKRARGRLAVR